VKLFEKFRDDVIAQLKDDYALTHVDYNDRLMSEQIDAVVAGDWETVVTSNMDWEGENRHHGATYEIKDEVESVAKDWEVHDRVKAYVDAGVITDWAEGDYPYDELADDFEHTPQWDEVLEAIKERDTSDPYKQLAGQSGQVLMRQVIANEDVALYGNHSPSAVIAWLKENLEPGSVLKRNKHNLDVVRSVISESMHSLAYSMGMIVYAANVGDLYEMGDCEYVEVVNPYLYIGNYYQGDGYCSEKPLDAVFRIKRSELTTDTGAAGYGWNEVAGVYTSAYEATVRKVAESEAA
jgi:hypothetical protein